MKVIYTQRKNKDLGSILNLFPSCIQEHINKYHNEKAKEESIQCWSLFYQGLEKYYPSYLKEEIVFLENGKPVFKNKSDLFFNLSHSHGVSVVGYDQENIGIDIEKITNKPNYLKIANRFFTPNEVNYLLNTSNKVETFLSIWTKKESYLKMLGEGLTISLNAFDTLVLNSMFYEINIKGFIINICSLNKTLNDVDIEEIR